MDLQDGGRRSLEVDGVLAGPAAWSPDGRLLAVTTVEPSSAPPGVDAPGIPTGSSFVDPTGRGARRARSAAARPHRAGARARLGGSGEVAHGARGRGRDPCCGRRQTLSGVPLDGTEPRPLMRMSDLGSYGVGRFQLASSVAGSLEVVDPDGVDRGPWPWALRGVLAVAAGLLAWLLARVAVRRRRS